MPTPDAYPTLELGGPRWRLCYQLPPEFPVVRGPVYADGGQDTFISFTTPIRRWVIDYEVLDEAEVGILDGHYESAQGGHLGFSFTDPETGTAHANVKYERFERPAHDLEWIQARRVQLIARP